MSTAMEATIPISETFASIQGEGKLTGVPSFFIRCSGCNLRCAWCDTPYASWQPDGGPRAIGAIIEEAKRSGVGHVVVTGGEPLMFPLVSELTAELRTAGLHITIETAGTILPPRAFACDLLSVSPKLSNSTPGTGADTDPRDPLRVWTVRHEQRRLNVPVLQELLDRHAERQLKFVVRGEADLGEIDGLLARLRGVAPADVMLMPEGTASPSAERRAWATRVCMERGWRYCHRLHIELFGNARGT